MILCLATLTDLPNRVLPRSISRNVEERRVERVFLGSMASVLIAFGACGFGQAARTKLKSAGLLVTSTTLAMLMVPLIQTVATSRHSARRAQCVNNLKQIALALHNYENTYGAYPPRVIRDHEGRPLLSWRVALLPFLEQRELYEKFRLDEPWNSPHNRPLIDQIPNSYVCPSQAEWSSRNQTLYQVLSGPGTFLDDSKPTLASEIGDGPDETIAVVEAPSPVSWTGPEDLPFRPDRPFPAWGVTHADGFNASYVDGSVRFLKRTMPEAELKASVTRSGKDR